MIIRPIETKSEFLAYGRARNYSVNHNFKGSFEKNIAKARSEYEFDAYDQSSFHFGSFKEGKLHACARMVNDTIGLQKFQLDEAARIQIKQLSEDKQPANGLPLQDSVHENESPIVEKTLYSFRKQGKSFNEIGRLIRCIKEDEKYLMSYMLCYAYAFNRFYNIDYCFFEAVKSHCPFYEQSFHCKHVLQEVEFTPMAGGESFYLMKATASDLPEKMDLIVNRIVHQFNASNKPCAVKLEDIK